MSTEQQVSCQNCHADLNTEEFLSVHKVCPHCHYYHYLSAFERLELLVDQGTFLEFDPDLYSVNPLDFPEYLEKLKGDIQKTGLKSEMLTGEGCIGGYRAAIGIGEAAIRMGSVGSCVGEKMTRLIEQALEKRLPLIIVSPFGGGMRMQEGTIALMQMAKTSAACARYKDAGLFYISIIVGITLGGSAASFASLGHVILAEPGARFGFSGDRARAAIGEKMPPEVQTAEFMLEHGRIDRIVHRKDLKATLVDLLDFCASELTSPPPGCDVEEERKLGNVKKGNEEIKEIKGSFPIS